MSRVDEQQQKAAADAERLQKQQDRNARDASKSDESRQRFGELVKQGAAKQQGQNQSLTKDLARQQGEQVAQQKHVGKEEHAARDARLARGGVVHHHRLMEQAKSFQGTLENRRTETEQTQKGRVETREEGLFKAKESTDERVTDLDQKKESRLERDKETARGETKAQGRVNAAIDGTGQKSSDGGGHHDGAHVQAKAKGVEGAGAAEGAQGAHEVKQIPEQILEALASEVYVGVNERGLMEFRIELKEGVLQGATLRVEAKDGGIQLRFEGLSGHAKNLVSASEGELGRRLKAKGLRLDTLAV